MILEDGARVEDERADGRRGHSHDSADLVVVGGPPESGEHYPDGPDGEDRLLRQQEHDACPTGFLEYSAEGQQSGRQHHPAPECGRGHRDKDVPEYAPVVVGTDWPLHYQVKSPRDMKDNRVENHP